MAKNALKFGKCAHQGLCKGILRLHLLFLEADNSDKS